VTAAWGRFTVTPRPPATTDLVYVTRSCPDCGTDVTWPGTRTPPGDGTTYRDNCSCQPQPGTEET
jgi:hypothetical protein